MKTLIFKFPQVLATAADPNLGGRNFDELLKDHFVEEFKVIQWSLSEYRNFWSFTHMTNFLHWPIIVYCKKKKSSDYPHWWITCTLCYSTFWWQKGDIKVIHFSLFKVVWSNFWKLESFFVEFQVQRNSDTCAIVSILACTLLIKLYSENTSGPCPNLNLSYLTECEFVATFCVSNHSVPCWFNLI